MFSVVALKYAPRNRLELMKHASDKDERKESNRLHGSSLCVRPINLLHAASLTKRVLVSAWSVD